MEVSDMLVTSVIILLNKKFIWYVTRIQNMGESSMVATSVIIKQP